MPYPDGLATLNFHLPGDLARNLADEGYEYSCYTRTGTTRGVFNSFVKDRVKSIETDPCMEDVMHYIDQDKAKFAVTHAITISSSTAFHGHDIGTIFLRYNTPASQRIKTPPFFTVMLIHVNSDDRYKGIGTLLMKLAKELTIDLASSNAVVREDVSIDEEYAYHLVAFLPLKDAESTPGQFETCHGFFDSLDFAPVAEGACNFGADVENELAYHLEVDVAGLLLPSPPSSPILTSANLKRVRFSSEGDEEIAAKLPRVSSSSPPSDSRS
jgi:hypothetical protein